MNILPFVFTFLLIFASLSITFFKEVKSCTLTESTLEGYSRTKRVVSNTLIKKAYQKIKSDPAVKKEAAKTRKAHYVSKRSFFPPLDNAKFNLAALVKEPTDAKLHPLYEVLARLLRILYQERVFSKEKEEKIEYRLMDVILKKARQISDVESLSELYPDDPMLKRIYYKLLRGTNQYSRTEGIAPLSDFVKFDTEAKAASLAFASPVLLEALFDADAAVKIVEEERKQWDETQKYYFFSKEDLQKLLMLDPVKAGKFTVLDTHLDYSKNMIARERLGGRDKKTGIGVQMRAR